MKQAAVWGAQCAVAPVLFLVIAGRIDGIQAERLACLGAGCASATVAASLVARHGIRALTGLQALYLIVAGGGVALSFALSGPRMDLLHPEMSGARVALMVFGWLLAFLVGVALALQVLLQHRSNRTRWGTLAGFVFGPGVTFVVYELFDAWRRDGTMLPMLERFGSTGLALLVAYGVAWTSLLMAASPPRGESAG